MKTATTRPRTGRSPIHQPIPAEWGWHYRTLLALRAHLRHRRGERLAEPCDAMEPPSLHCEDLADELYDRDLAKALPTDSGAALREIEDALERLRTGRYGRCETTGRPIPKSRLREMPWRRSALASPI
jgi:RNA polymerase-binding transcription factor DksA